MRISTLQEEKVEYHLLAKSGSTSSKKTEKNLDSRRATRAQLQPRLPPGQQVIEHFPVLDLGIQPTVNLKEWRLSITGQVNVPTMWDWDTFLAQPQKAVVSDIHCVTAWSRFSNEWQGVLTRHMLSVVQPKASAKFATLLSFDGYITNVPLAALKDEDVLLAHSWQGKPLELAHGWPVRVVIPKLYFWKSAKWIRQIVFLDTDRPGYWEERGYHNSANPWREERYNLVSPRYSPR